MKDEMLVDTNSCMIATAATHRFLGLLQCRASVRVSSCKLILADMATFVPRDSAELFSDLS
jgi:hypothetical protein